jgi:hypothetical protein
MRSVIESIVRNDGILAVGYRQDDGPIELVADSLFPEDKKLQWKRIMASISHMFDRVENDPTTWERSVSPPRSLIRCDIGSDTWNAARQSGLTLVLVSVKGHPISKSLKRMTRRGFKNAQKQNTRAPAPTLPILRLLPDPTPEAGVPKTISESAKTTKIDTTT